MSFAALLLLFAPASQVLVDEVFEIPASQWRFAPVTPAHTPARLECDFRVVSGNAPVRVVLMDGEEFRRLKAGDRELLDPAEPALRGTLARLVSASEEYDVVVDNGQAGGPIRVKLRVTEYRLLVNQLSPERRFAVIVISVSVFLAIVIFSGRRLLRAVR
jgi:hypothetical protein